MIAKLSLPRTACQTKARVLLAIDFQLLSDLLQDFLADEPFVDVVGQVVDPADLLVAVGRTAANVVIQNWESAGQMPGICTHLLAAYPDLLVIGLGPDGEHNYTCRRPIVVDGLPALGLPSVQEAIYEALADFVVPGSLRP